MSMNATPSANRPHIAFFGRRNAGKSSVVNAVTGQNLAVVSEIKGTTTDPVYKAMELLPLGPVVIIDTPGFDDEGPLGTLRVKKTRQVLNKADIAVLVVDAAEGLTPADREWLRLFQEKDVPHLVVYNKTDLLPAQGGPDARTAHVSALTKAGIDDLKERIARMNAVQEDRRIAGDLVHAHDVVVLVTPIDAGAPKGRLILPQQQTLRDLLEAGAVSVVVREHELREALGSLGKRPSLVITDSQAFAKVAAETPRDVPLTSFSILMARYKGWLDIAVRGAAAMDRLEDGDAVLIAEGCTHHRQCDDIGSVKLPRWLRSYTGKQVNIQTVSGTEFPEDLSAYRLVLHCGGCMLNEREVRWRMKAARDQGIPITNYGIAIAGMQGILRRSLEVFPDLLAELGARDGAG